MWICSDCIKEPGKAFLPYRMRVTEKNPTDKKGTLSPYYQLVNYLLPTYAADKVIAEAECEIMNYKQPVIMSGARYLETF